MAPIFMSFIHEEELSALSVRHFIHEILQYGCDWAIFILFLRFVTMSLAQDDDKNK